MDLCGNAKCIYCCTTKKPFLDQHGVVHYSGQLPPKTLPTETKVIDVPTDADLRWWKEQRK